MEGIVEFVLGFTLFGSVVAFWLVTVIMILLLFSYDLDENGWPALASFGVFCVLTYFWSEFNILTYATLKNVLIYIGIGFIYAMIRTIIFAKSKKGDFYTGEEAYRKNREYKLGKLKGNVRRWWFLFPVSLLNWIFSDLIGDIKDFLVNSSEKIFLGIFNKILPEEEKEKN